MTEAPGSAEELIRRRRKLGINTFDEVWEGSLHLAPDAHPAHGYIDNELAALLAPVARSVGLVGAGPFNLGDPDDYRVPDGGCHRGLPTTTWVPTAAVVVEVVSPDDETYDKFGFYAAHGVDELIVADPARRTVSCWARDGLSYRDLLGSELLGVTAQWLRDSVVWAGSSRGHPIIHPTNCGAFGRTRRNRIDDRSERSRSGGPHGARPRLSRPF